jgi:copper oxidase (laccase) domain-containing protein
MRLVHASAFAVAFALLTPAPIHAQQDADRKVAGGGISVAGWKGAIDPAAAKKGLTINDSKFTKDGDALHLAVGPAAVYWNPANTASGDYTVKATFREAKISADHPHPYGVFIGGQNLDSDQRSLMYCVAYGDGSFLVRQLTPTGVVNVGKRQPNAAVHKAAADGSVTNEVGWTVKGGRAECVINGTVVAGYDKQEIVGAGKLESTDGVYGIRVSHNVDVVVTGLGVTK